MSETNQCQTKQHFLITLVLLLFVIIGAQAWHMLNLEQQLHTLKSQQDIPQFPVDVTTEQNNDNAKRPVVEPEDTTISEDSSSYSPNTSTKDTGASKVTQANDDTISDAHLHEWTPDPYEEFHHMQRKLNKLFNESTMFADNRPEFQRHSRHRMSSPKIDVREDNDRYIVHVNAPGSNEDNISVNLNRQRLTIKTRQGYEKRESYPSGNFSYRERSSGSFQRSIMLREPVIPNGMKTRFENGILKIMIPKAQ